MTVMKRISILGVCALIGLGAMAQETVLKDAEKLMKSNASYTDVVKAVTPAMSDPTTQNSAQTYYIPGKAGFNTYDNALAKEALGQLDEAGKKEKVEALMGGYEYMMKALPLDSVVDAKGKVKTKYSKDIVNTVAGHYNDFCSAGIDLWGFQEFDKAYDAWEAYTTLPSIPAFAKAITMPADSTLSEIMYNQALAAWQANDLEKSLQSFLNARAKGYDKKQLYDYAIAVATGAGKDDVVTELAYEAQAKYGEEDSNYMGYIINGFINKKQYAEAIEAIDKAIAAEPNNAQYHVIKGILYETEDINKDPEPEYQAAVDLDSHNAQALYNLGRMHYNKALNIYNDAPNDNAAFNKVFNEDFKPVMLQAVDLFERSYAVDDTNMDVLKLLENAYYMLNDDANMKDVQARMGR